MDACERTSVRLQASDGRAFAEASPVSASFRDRFDRLAGVGCVHGLGDIGLTDYSDQIVTVDYGEAPNLMLLHRRHRFLESIVGANGDGLPFSEITSARDRGVNPHRGATARNECSPRVLIV